jgi:hypothetical protein
MEKLEYQVNNNDLFHDGGNGVPSEQWRSVLWWRNRSTKWTITICFIMEVTEYQVNNNDLFYDGGTGVLRYLHHKTDRYCSLGTPVPPS